MAEARINQQAMGDDVMTHNFKTGVTYKTRGGDKAWFIGDHQYGLEYPCAFAVRGHKSVFGYTNDGVAATGFVTDYDIIGSYEDEPEQIDVANMWVVVRGDGGAISYDVDAAYHTLDVAQSKAAVMSGAMPFAIIRVSEWEAIKRGERKLRIGEGL